MKRIAQVLLIVLLAAAASFAQHSGELRFCLRADPKTFDPLLMADEVSESIRYMTGGYLVRVNRQTQQLEPSLATSWKLSPDGKTITFHLREHIYYHDGTAFTADDVAATIRRLMDPNTHSPVGDTFQAGSGTVTVTTPNPQTVVVTFPNAIAGVERLFDEVAIASTKSPKKEMAALGPFYVADQKSGSYVYLKANPNYWEHDAAGKQLPYLDAVRLEIQPNRDIEMMKFQRGEVHLINALDSEYYDKLSAVASQAVRDIGPSLDSEQMWFNQVAKAPIPAYKLAWFRSGAFRRAVSTAINRADLARVVFGSHAQPAIGPISPANKFWFNQKLKAPAYDASAALKLLQAEKFRFEHGELHDAAGNLVEFSIITNAGNKYRERMAAMIQQDLAKIGIRVNVVALDFPSLIERITEKFNYEAAMLGTVNTGLDPNGGMNVYLSSGENHQWNPHQASPETEWEAKIDRDMKAQAGLSDAKKRKAYFDDVQDVLVREEPFIYLVNKNSLSAISPAVHGAAPVVLRPQTWWNIERLSLTK
jgi:peptide/nickel transport system substrate-binding protein